MEFFIIWLTVSFVLLVVGFSIDGLMTYYGISNGIIEEGNPSMANFIKNAGLVNGIVISRFALFLIYFICWSYWISYPVELEFQIIIIISTSLMIIAQYAVIFYNLSFLI